jgi:Fibronectin type III domain
VEKLQFSDGTVTVATPAAPGIGTVTAGNASATVTFTAPAANGSPAVSGFEIVATPSTVTTATPVVTRTGIAPTARTATVTGLVNGTAYTFQVRAVNEFGPGPLSAASVAVTPRAPIAGVPAVPTNVRGVRGNARVDLSWTAGSNGGSTVTSHRILVFVGNGTTPVQTINTGSSATTRRITGLTNGTAYTFEVRATNAIGSSAFSTRSASVTPATTPGTAVIGNASSGTAGGTVNATARWTPPATTGGSPITGYRVRGLRLNAAGTVLSTTTSAVQPATARSFVMTLPVSGANYRFTVQAINAVGNGAQSARSNQVVGR